MSQRQRKKEEILVEMSKLPPVQKINIPDQKCLLKSCSQSSVASCSYCTYTCIGYCKVHYIVINHRFSLYTKPTKIKISVPLGALIHTNNCLLLVL